MKQYRFEAARSLFFGIIGITIAVLILTSTSLVQVSSGGFPRQVSTTKLKP
jgi:hypothetical protein